MEALIVLKHIVVYATLAAIAVVVITVAIKALSMLVTKPAIGVPAAAGLAIVAVSFIGFGWNATLGGVANLNTVINRHQVQVDTSPKSDTDMSLQKANNHGKHHVRP